LTNYQSLIFYIKYY